MMGSGRCSVFSCYLPRVLASYSAEQIVAELPVVSILSQGAEICVVFTYSWATLIMTKLYGQAGVI